MFIPSPACGRGCEPRRAGEGPRGRRPDQAERSLSHSRTFALSHSTDMSILLDYNNMLAPRLGGRGIDPAKLEGMANRFRAAHEDTVRRRDAGELGFYALADGGETVQSIQEFAEGGGQAFSNVVVLGIGGSALGTV